MEIFVEFLTESMYMYVFIYYIIGYCLWLPVRKLCDNESWKFLKADAADVSIASL